MLPRATFALGCFWCPDAQFGALPGVIRTCVGYCGGTRPVSPTYKNIGDHSECVQIDFDPQRITHRELLDAFWRWHDPLSQYGEGQYASAIFYQTDEQRQEAEESKRKQERQYARPLQTRIGKMNKFTRAEEHHQKVRVSYKDV
jgi:methionine-S-sulfoxide reductase